MTTTMKRDRARTLLETTLEVRATSDLPSGVCGQVVGVALVYGVRDAYGTAFAPGCLDRTKREKLAAGKIALYANHEYQTHAHVGVIRGLDTTGDREIMTADIFDTAAGRALKEYLSAVTATGAHTGLSVGFFDRASDLRDDGDGDRTLWYTEVELEEVSATPRPAVPGADVLAVRAESDTDAPAFAVGDRIVSHATHMKGMDGATGTVSIVKDGPFYGVTFDGSTTVHKWLAQSEMTPEKAGEKDKKMPAMSRALRSIITTMGAQAVRAEIDAVAGPGNAVPPEDSSSAAPAETSDAEGEDSHRRNDPVAATMDERIAAVRTSYSPR